MEQNRNSIAFRLQYSFMPFSKECNHQLSTNMQHIFTNSGRDLFQKGDIESCLNSKNFKYSVVEFGLNKLDLGPFIGLCLPISCTDSALTKVANSVVKHVSPPLKVLLVSSHTNTIQSVQWTWMAFLTLALFAVIIALVIWATFFEETPTIVKAFDFKKNMEHFKIRQNKDLNIFDGVRAICIMWIVFGHNFSYRFMSGQKNRKTIGRQTNSPFCVLLEEGLLAVDVFFMMSGFFLAYIFLKQARTSNYAYPLAVVHRILRIWPAFFFSITFFGFIFAHISEGSLWQRIYSYVQNCDSFWQSLFFVGNLMNSGQKICMSWSWYIQVDMQIFLASMVVLFFYDKYRLFSHALLAAMIIGSLVFLFVSAQENQFQIYWNQKNFVELMKYIQGVYMKPWSRCPSYFIGLILGQQFIEFKKTNPEQNYLMMLKQKFMQNFQLRSLFQVSGVIIMAVIVFFPSFVQSGYHFPQQFTSFFIVLSRPAFLIGVILTILPTILGFSDSFINLLLTPKIFHFISRISFCTYLIHIMVIYKFTYGNSFDYYFNLKDITVTYFGVLVVSLFFAFWLTMCVEVPFSNLQKMLIRYLTVVKQEREKRVETLEEQNSVFQQINEKESK